MCQLGHPIAVPVLGCWLFLPLPNPANVHHGRSRWQSSSSIPTTLVADPEWILACTWILWIFEKWVSRWELSLSLSLSLSLWLLSLYLLMHTDNFKKENNRNVSEVMYNSNSCISFLNPGKERMQLTSLVWAQLYQLCKTERKRDVSGKMTLNEGV